MTSDLEVLFQGFHEQDIREFLARGEPVAFEQDEVILTAGRSEWDLYVIEEGSVSLWVGNVRLEDLEAGRSLGSSAILAPQIQWSAVRGNTPGTLLKIPREAVLGFFEARPERVFQQFCVNLFRLWVEVLRQRNGRMMELQDELLAGWRQPGRRFKVMIVEDEEGIRTAMVEFFDAEYDVVTASSGRDGVDLAFSERPDLVLLDLRLPDLDGFQVCEQLKRHPDTGHILIVMVTALATTPDRVKGMMYGADEYLVKPVDFGHLKDAVQRLLVKAYG